MQIVVELLNELLDKVRNEEDLKSVIALRHRVKFYSKEDDVSGGVRKFVNRFRKFIEQHSERELLLEVQKVVPSVDVVRIWLVVRAAYSENIWKILNSLVGHEF